MSSKIITYSYQVIYYSEQLFSEKLLWGACPATPSRVARDGVAVVDLGDFDGASSVVIVPIRSE